MVSILLLSLHNANGARRFILGLLLAKSTRAEGIIPKIDLLREMGVRICQLVDGGGSDPGYDSASDSDDGRTAVDSLTEPNFRDEYERELRVMADVRAYFQIAYKVRWTRVSILQFILLLIVDATAQRVIDYIPLTIDHQFLYGCRNSVQRVLFERLGLGEANPASRCASYIAEDPTVVTARDELLGKKKRLEAVQRALFRFGL